MDCYKRNASYVSWHKTVGMATARVRADIIGHARIQYVGISQSCTVYNGRFIPHSSYLSRSSIASFGLR